mgnify:FL=1
MSTRAFFKKKVRAEPEQEQGSEFNEESLDPILRSCLMDTNMTREKAIQIPAVTGVIDEIAKTVANIPIKLYKKENGKSI